MERQKPSTDLKHNDDFSKALIESYGRWMGGAGFGQHLAEEGIPAEQKQGPESPAREGGADAATSIPSLEGKEEKSDEGAKDIKAGAGAPDPANDVRTGSGNKYSLGAEIRDTTKVVTKESCDTCSYCGGKGCSKCEKEDKKDMKKETYSFELDGVEYVFEAEKKKGLDGKACWKGYKQMGTKMKGGKRVDNCVKAGYEPEGEMIDEKKKLDPVNHKALKGDHADRKDKDIDNDGDVDKSDKYLHSRRKKVSAIIGAKKKMKEEAELRKEIEEEKK
jgi:hypothetical protein